MAYINCVRSVKFSKLKPEKLRQMPFLNQHEGRSGYEAACRAILRLNHEAGVGQACFVDDDFAICDSRRVKWTRMRSL